MGHPTLHPRCTRTYQIHSYLMGLPLCLSHAHSRTNLTCTWYTPNGQWCALAGSSAVKVSDATRLNGLHVQHMVGKLEHSTRQAASLFQPLLFSHSSTSAPLSLFLLHHLSFFSTSSLDTPSPPFFLTRPTPDCGQGSS